MRQEGMRMPASDIKSIVLLMFAATLGTVSNVHADDTPLEAFASQTGATVVRAAQTGDDGRRVAAVGSPSALDTFVKQVGFDITAIPPEIRAEWVNSSRAVSLPHEMFCPIQSGGGEVRAENASAAIYHVNTHAFTGRHEGGEL